MHLCMRAWTPNENEMETEETALERRRRLARERVLVEGEGFCCSLYKQPLMNTVLILQMGVTNVNLSFYIALTPSNNLDVSVHATSVQKCVKRSH